MSEEQAGTSQNNSDTGTGNSKQNPPDDAATASAPDADATDLVKVNTQIVDAVQQTRNAVRISADDTSKVLDAGIGYQKASQAAAFAVQDATDYLRNVMTIASTTEGIVLKLMIEHKEEAAQYLPILTAAQGAVSAAAAALTAVGTAATGVASHFPR